jgi:hypothetical protein
MNITHFYIEKDDENPIYVESNDDFGENCQIFHIDKEKLMELILDREKFQTVFISSIQRNVDSKIVNCITFRHDNSFPYDQIL